MERLLFVLRGSRSHRMRETWGGVVRVVVKTAVSFGRHCWSPERGYVSA